MAIEEYLGLQRSLKDYVLLNSEEGDEIKKMLRLVIGVNQDMYKYEICNLISEKTQDSDRPKKPGTIEYTLTAIFGGNKMRNIYGLTGIDPILGEACLDILKEKYNLEGNKEEIINYVEEQALILENEKYIKKKSFKKNIKNEKTEREKYFDLLTISCGNEISLIEKVTQELIETIDGYDNKKSVGFLEKFIILSAFFKNKKNGHTQTSMKEIVKISMDLGVKKTHVRSRMEEMVGVQIDYSHHERKYGIKQEYLNDLQNDLFS